MAVSTVDLPARQSATYKLVLASVSSLVGIAKENMAKHKRNAAVAQADTPAAKPPAKPKAPMDPRFAALQTDPRFERFPAPGKSVTIDERFAGERSMWVLIATP